MSIRRRSKRLRVLAITAISVAAALGIGFGVPAVMADDNGKPTQAEAAASDKANAQLLDAKCAVPGDRDLKVTTQVYQVGKNRQVNKKVMLAMFEAGWVESHMNNLNCGHADSVGVFQQRPSMGWCDPAKLCRDVKHATNKFLDQAIPNDKKNPGYSAGELAQSVQRSGYPGRYDQAKDKANKLLSEASGAPLPDAEWPKIKNGSNGADVETAQYLLTAHKHKAVVDGDFGPQTEKAAKAFQKDKKLVVDGVIGSQTWPVLVIEVANGDKGDAVKALQQQLNAHGEKLKVNGSFDDATEAALKKFEKRAKIEADGKADKKTWKSLIGT